MTYNAKTKYQIKEGTLLKGYAEDYLVTEVFQDFGKITTQVIFKDGTKGTHIYFQPYTYYYGCTFNN